MKSRFLGCVLDTDSRSLARDATGVHLTPKAFDVLALLVSERPRGDEVVLGTVEFVFLMGERRVKTVTAEP